MKSWNQFKRELLNNKAVKLEYQKLQPRYTLIKQLVEARLKRGLTQKQLAVKIGTKQSAISRLEAGNINPTIDFLEKVTVALHSQLDIRIHTV